MVNKITDYQIIGRFINDYKRKYYLRELARQLGKPHQTIKPYVERLVKKGILLRNKRENLIEYELNFKNGKTREN